MSDPVSLSEAKAFLRVTHDAEDDVISMLLEAAKCRVEDVVGVGVDEAPVRLSVLYLVAQAYSGRGEVEDVGAVEAWLAPYRQVRL